MRTSPTTSTLFLLLLGLGLSLATSAGASQANTTCSVLHGPAPFKFGHVSTSGKPLATLPFDPILGALAVPVVEASCPVPSDAYLQLLGTTTAILD